MKFYYRSSINKEEMFTIWQNRLKRTVKFNRKFLTNEEFQCRYCLQTFLLCFFVSVFNYSLLPNNSCIISSKFKCALLFLRKFPLEVWIIEHMTLSPLSSAIKILLKSKIEALLDFTLGREGGGGGYSPIKVTGVLVVPCRV